MKEENKNILAPQYMKKFRCIGTDCEDTCCSGWSVFIDHSTYKKYKNIKHKDLSIMFKNNIIRNRSNQTENHYGDIKLNDKKTCPFLNEGKLCEIHSKLGEKFLSNVCKIYPRNINFIDGVFEKCASLSCIEAARLALLDPNPMEFDEYMEHTYYGDNCDYDSIINNINTSVEDFKNRPFKYFWELRMFTISLLQNREYKLWERLIILGLFYNSLEEKLKTEKIDYIPEQISYFTKNIMTGVYKDALKDVAGTNLIQINILKAIIDMRFIVAVPNQRYTECVDQFKKGIGNWEDLKGEGISVNYENAFNKYYEPFMSGHEYILENYLVNYIFKNLFPFTSKEGMFEDYTLIVIHYALIKMHLIGMAAYHKENFNQDQVIKLIQAFVKTVEHNTNFLTYIKQWLKENKVNTMAHMAILIKN